MSRFYLKMEAESISETLFLNKNRTMENVQKHNNGKVDVILFIISSVSGTSPPMGISCSPKE
jgi:hypothetical protein